MQSRCSATEIWPLLSLTLLLILLSLVGSKRASPIPPLPSNYRQIAKNSEAAGGGGSEVSHFSLNNLGTLCLSMLV